MDAKPMIHGRAGPDEILPPHAGDTMRTARSVALTPAGAAALAAASAGIPSAVRTEPWPASPRRWQNRPPPRPRCELGFGIEAVGDCNRG
jgi:hypothetical protein